MRLFSPAGKIKIAGLVLIVLVCVLVPLLYSQSRRIVTVQTDGSSYLGITMEDVTADSMAKYKLTSERGVIVKSVEKGSPAETARIQENDVILDYASVAVMSASQFSRMVRETPVGRRVDLVVSRDGKKVNLTAQIGKRPGSNLEEFGSVAPGGSGRTFEFFGPNGRTFQFRAPDGRGLLRSFPNDGFWLQGSRPRMGVTLEPLTDQMAEFLAVPGKKGALVTSVSEGSPAASKLKAGDVIISADTKSISSPDDLSRILQGKKDDEKVNLKIIRDKKELSVTVELSGTQTRRGVRL